MIGESLLRQCWSPAFRLLVAGVPLKIADP
jgi:hypothetical protein